METLQSFKAPFVLFYKNNKQFHKDMILFYFIFSLGFGFGFLEGLCQFSVENDLKRFRAVTLPLHIRPLQNRFWLFLSLSFWIFSADISKHILLIRNFHMGPTRIL